MQVGACYKQLTVGADNAAMTYEDSYSPVCKIGFMHDVTHAAHLHAGATCLPCQAHHACRIVLVTAMQEDMDRTAEYIAVACAGGSASEGGHLCALPALCPGGTAAQ